MQQALATRQKRIVGEQMMEQKKEQDLIEGSEEVCEEGKQIFERGTALDEEESWRRNV